MPHNFGLKQEHLDPSLRTEENELKGVEGVRWVWDGVMYAPDGSPVDLRPYHKLLPSSRRPSMAPPKFHYRRSEYRTPGEPTFDKEVWASKREKIAANADAGRVRFLELFQQQKTMTADAGFSFGDVLRDMSDAIAGPLPPFDKKNTQTAKAILAARKLSDWKLPPPMPAVREYLANQFRSQEPPERWTSALIKAVWKEKVRRGRRPKAPNYAPIKQGNTIA